MESGAGKIHDEVVRNPHDYSIYEQSHFNIVSVFPTRTFGYQTASQISKQKASKADWYIPAQMTSSH
jgi:hypothetical protein